jgi:hypothetical protein
MHRCEMKFMKKYENMFQSNYVKNFGCLIAQCSVHMHMKLYLQMVERVNIVFISHHYMY